MNTQEIAITMEAEELRELCHKIEHNALYAAVVHALAGETLETLEEYFDEWDQNWPVINADLTLTGSYADSDTLNMVNYDDRALIDRDEAIEGGWEIDSDNGYANPPEKSEK